MFNKLGLLGLLVMLVALAASPVPSVQASSDFRADMSAANAALAPVMKKAEKLVAAGKLDEGDDLVLATFPEATRTPAQALMLGNVLYGFDPVRSYALHKQAALALPNESAAQFEWAMEQHRAGEFTGALESYAAMSKGEPDYAPAYGLAADCLMHLGKIEDAVAMWKKSEAAQGGTLEQFETLVCEVKTRSSPQRRRADLLAKATAGDAEAAIALVFHDCNFERDWWNGGVFAKYLEHDLGILRHARMEEGAKRKEALCAGECALLAEKGPKSTGLVVAALRASGFLVDDAHSLPTDGRMLSVMLNAALTSGAITREDARTRWLDAIVAAAKERKDPELFYVAAHIALESDALAPIDREGWESTGDARFGASWLAGRAAKKELTLDDPVLAQVVARYPDNAVAAGLVAQLTVAAGKPPTQALINAIKAEYARFSPASGPSPLVARPGAALLQSYFHMLAGELQRQK